MASCACCRPNEQGRRYCIAGGPCGLGCNNNQSTKGISIHFFPNKKKKDLCQTWISLERKHRPDFRPSKSSMLCSAHLKSSCFTSQANIHVAGKIGIKRYLERDAIPTIDSDRISAIGSSAQPEPLIDCSRTEVSKHISKYIVLPTWHIYCQKMCNPR